MALKIVSATNFRAIFHLGVYCKSDRFTSDDKTGKRMENIFISGYSGHERHSVIEFVKRIVGKYGYILDAKLFSDVSMNVTIGIAESKIDSLYRELSESLATEKFEYLNSASTKERTVFLNVTFTKGTGDLRIKVPAVPG